MCMEQFILLFEGVGPYLEPDELDMMASDPKSDYSFMVNDYAALASVGESFAEKTCAGIIKIKIRQML